MALSKSARVKLIQKITVHLEKEEWPIIDLTLKQFGFPVTDIWEGTTKAYLVEMLTQGNESDLTELAEHIDSDAPGESIVPLADVDYWETGKLRTFISHLSGNKKQASDLQDQLSSFGLTGFVAHKDIHPTSEWQTEIEAALATCELMVALVYPGFKESEWCDQEIGYALGKGVPVFTIRVGADPTGFVSRFQAFNGKGKTAAKVAVEIFDAAIAHKQMQVRMAEILLAMFESSGSFAAARDHIGYLERLTHWKPSYSKRIRKALKENYEIEHSFTVPDRVAALVKKWA